jgi:SAM-dependent methyltransferase
VILRVKQAGKQVDLFSRMLPGRLLDFPVGRGRQSAQLVGLGYRVVGADLFASADARLSLPCVRADGNVSFPFKDESFDYVLSREGIEHLEHQAGFIRECIRVLRAGGSLLLTTPNMMHLNARLSYLLVGQRILRRGLVNEVQTLRNVEGGKFYHGHAFLIDYFRLRYLLRLAGFTRIEVFTDRYSPTSIALSWLVPILFAATMLSIRMSIRKKRSKGNLRSYNPIFSDIVRHVFSPALLFGKRMIVTAEKAARIVG